MNNNELLNEVTEEEWDKIIFTICKKFIPFCNRDVLIDLDDLKQEAWLALLKACQNYDPDKAKNNKFTSYAWIYIHGRLCRFVKSKTMNKPSTEDIDIVPLSDEGKSEEVFINHDFLRTVFDLLEDQKHLIHLYEHYILNQSFREIAENHGVSRNLIHLRVKKMLEILNVRLRYENATTY